MGKHLFRVRERHVAEHIAPLLADKAVGAAKLDLLLRGIALLPALSGKRPPGMVLPFWSYAHLFDLVEDPDHYGRADDQLDYPADVLRLKRKWIGEQLQRLEEMKLVRRGNARNGRPTIFVLRDDGSGKAFDDPDGKAGNSYLTVSGSVIATGKLRTWKAPELAFYLAAMIAERYAANRVREHRKVDKPWEPGAGQWFATLDWFADPHRRRPATHVRVPFTVPTLERGLRSLVAQGLVERRRIAKDPVTGRTFARPRNLYTNRFVDLDAGATQIDQAALDALIREFLGSSQSRV